MLGAITAFAPLSIDMYLPALPALARDFGTGPSEVQLTLSTFFFGLAFGQAIIGPLSEVDVLAIDELGKGRGSPFELDTMDELIARRYNAGRTTLFATNYSLDPGDKRTPSVRTAAPCGLGSRDSFARNSPMRWAASWMRGSSSMRAMRT